jgi:nucleoside-diphosphate-sugar epimerase
MRILVTGHEGYLGSVLSVVLEQAGHEVLGLDTGWFRECVLGPAPTAPVGHPRDLRSLDPDLLDGVDAVVNLAALCNDAIGARLPELTMAINHRATLELARVARAAGVGRFVQSSTCSVYGDAPVDVLVDESSPVRPLTAYAVAKVEAEKGLLALADDGFAPVCLRNATAFGFSSRQRLDIVINELVAAAHLDGVVRVSSDGTPWRPFVHVRDIAHAFVAALDAPAEEVTGIIVNVGNESLNLQIADVANAVAEFTGAEIEIAGLPSPDARSYRVGFARLQALFPALPPRVSLEEGIRELHDAYRRFGIGAYDMVERLRRLAWLDRLAETGELDDDLRWRAPA